MKVTVSGTMVHLQGEWTLGGLTNVTIGSLTASLQRIKSGGEKRILVDCRQVTAIDSIGLMILDGLMYVPGLKGIRAELVSLPEKLRPSFMKSGLKINHEQNDVSNAPLA